MTEVSHEAADRFQPSGIRRGRRLSSSALGVELGHCAFAEVAAVAGLPFVGVSASTAPTRRITDASFWGRCPRRRRGVSLLDQQRRPTPGQRWSGPPQESTTAAPTTCQPLGCDVAIRPSASNARGTYPRRRLPATAPDRTRAWPRAIRAPRHPVDSGDPVRGGGERRTGRRRNARRHPCPPSATTLTAGAGRRPSRPAPPCGAAPSCPASWPPPSRPPSPPSPTPPASRSRSTARRSRSLGFAQMTLLGAVLGGLLAGRA